MFLNNSNQITQKRNKGGRTNEILRKCFRQNWKHSINQTFAKVEY